MFLTTGLIGRTSQLIDSVDATDRNRIRRIREQEAV